MWELGNRGVIVLISVLIGCALIYNAWGPILALAISLFLVLYACYSLVINDSLLSPHAFLAFDYLKDAAAELRLTLDVVLAYVREYAFRVRDSLLARYRQRFSRMDRRRRSNYQLSTDPLPSRNSPVGRNPTANVDDRSRFSLMELLSPISSKAYKDAENESRFCRESDFGSENQEQFDMVTSTPVTQQDLGRFSAGKSTPRKKSPMYSQSHTLSRGDGKTYFSPDGSPWGNSISPKLRPKAGGIKTVQTVAGPLLASTRYNIDPKVYSDVTSPGLTTRLTKYATEANGKLTHQAQYGTGQFPKVNLHAGPLPLLNKKTVKNRAPVTVRVAPPEVARYSPPERQRILSKLCHVEDKAPSVVEVLREISLKRHASREEVAADLIKKQRTDGIFTEELEGMEEINQKRSRDESSKSEDDISPQNKTVRPTKRTKAPSCYDILNSLSSSINVASGVKRKAMDFSRSGTPDFEKHFKSLESVQTTEAPSTPPSSNAVSRQQQLSSGEKHTREDVYSPCNRSQETIPMKGILKVPGKQSLNIRAVETIHKPQIQVKSARSQSETSVAAAAPINVADKLFMRAERQVNERLKSLVEEQGNIKAKFTSDDVEEIKKEDIINMRQTSMRARLQSMFDAISGKAPSRINPDVVIQAEEVTPVATEVPTTCATLNSSTTTTNVNTTPISTSAIVPFGSQLEPNTRQTKHVAFNLPSTQASNTSATKTTQQTVGGKAQSASPPMLQNVGTTSSSGLNFPNVSAGGTLSFGKPSTSVSMPTPIPPTVSDTVLSFGVSAVNSNTATPSVAQTVLSSLPSFGSCASTTSACVVPTFGMPKTQEPSFACPSTGPSVAQTNVTSTSNFSFGNPGTSTATANLSTATPSSSTVASIFGTSQTRIVSTSAAVSTTGSTVSTLASSSNALSNTTSATSTPSLFTFGNNTNIVQTTKSELFSFGAASTAAPTGTGFGQSVTSTSMFNGTRNFAATTSSTSAFVTSTTATPSSFGVAQTTSIFSFGTSKPSVSESKSPFAFGPSAAASTASTTPAISSSTSIFESTSNKMTPSFGASATSAPAFGTQATSATGFGAATTSSTAFGATNIPATAFVTPSTSTVAFGAPATSTSTFGTPATSTSTFGTPATSTSTFGTPATSTTFGTQSTSTSTFNAPSTTTAIPQFGSGSAPLFGAPATSTFGSSSQPVFGGASTSGAMSTFNTPKTASVSVFDSGAVSTTLKSVSTTPSLFSGTNTTTATTSAATKPMFRPDAGIFGQTKPPISFRATSPVFGANSTLLFGQQTQPAPTFGTANPTTTTTGLTFGASNVSTTTATLNFGSTSTSTTPAFGSQTIGVTTPAQNTSTAPTFGGTNSIFGSASTSTSGTFGTAPSAFGGQSSGAIPFGGSNNPPAFGENRPSPFAVPTTSAPPFGAAAAAAAAAAATTAATVAPIFGTGGSGTSGGIFSFGGGQKPAQLNTTFSFGNAGTSSNNNNNATSTAPTPFQFTGTQAKPAASTGFNFTAPTSTPSINFNTSGTPTFNAATPGMFNIGSGSTAPRLRNVRQRKPR